MREHLQTTGYLQAKSPAHGTNNQTLFGNDQESSYSVAFRELFCITAHDIAKTLDTSLQNLGSLYEDVLTTGTLMPQSLWQSHHGNKRIIAADVAPSTRDIEAGVASPLLFGRGQMLVLTKKVDSSEADRLQNLGYKFVGVEQVTDSLTRSLQIPRDDLVDMISRLRFTCVREPCLPKNGTYLASFLIQPSPAVKGLEVIVPRTNPDRLPMVKLSKRELDSRQTSLLAGFDGLSLDECLDKISHRPRTMSVDDMFLESFRNRIFDLLQDCPEQALRKAIFSSHQVEIAHGVFSHEESSQATMFAFCGIKEIYNQKLPSLTLKTVPLSFFQTCLRSYPGCPDHAILAQKNHKEFGGIQRLPSLSRPGPSRQSSKWPHRLRGTKPSSGSISWRADSCSEHGLVNEAQTPPEMPTGPWGGIMVTSTRDVIHGESRKGSNVELHDLGVRAEVGIAETEQQTMVDKLMSITTAFRSLYSSRVLSRDNFSDEQGRF